MASLTDLFAELRTMGVDEDGVVDVLKSIYGGYWLLMEDDAAAFGMKPVEYVTMLADILARHG